MSEPKASIPKFGSFRPKSTAPVAEPASGCEVSGKEENNRKRRSSTRGEEREQDEKRYQRHHHRRHRSRSRERSRRQVEVTHPLPTPVKERPQEPDIFVIDTKGDEKNLIYGSIHRYDIPVFRRAGAGNVLGASTRLKIDRDFAEDKGLVLSNWRDSIFSHRERYVFSKIERERPRLLKIRPQALAETSSSSDASFIRLDDSKKRKRAGSGDPGSSDDEDEANYRSIHGKKKVGEQPEDDALQYATDSDQEGDHLETPNSAVRQRNMELNRQVDQFPDNIDAWVALIDFQDTLLHGEDDQHRATNAEIKSTAEIKIHMYEKALERFKSLADRERLLLGLMTEGSKVWESKYQIDRWEEISKANIDSLMLWKSYLNFRQATFASFRYEEVRDIFLARIMLLKGSIQVAKVGDVSALYQQLIYVLLRATVFIRESGFTELSVAIWQGLLEVNACGLTVGASQSDKIKALGEFWESEVARIGEDGALGFNHFIQKQGASDVPEGIADEVDNELRDEKLFSGWAFAERSRQNASLLPARTMDDVVEDDPYRVILFTDIESFIIVLPSDEGLHESLLDAFLAFCRMPTLSCLGFIKSVALPKDTFTEERLLDCDPAYIMRQFTTPDSRDGGDLEVGPAFKFPASNYSTSPETMFSSKFWFQAMPSWKDQHSGNNQPVSYTWVRNILKQINTLCFREYLAEYYLAFEWRNEPDTIKKVSKNLLKNHPSSLKLYNAYAMIESARGNKDIANAVFSAALVMGNSMPPTDGRESIVLWKSWVWAGIEDSDKHAALKRLLSIPDGVLAEHIAISPAILLKTKQHLSSNRDFLLSSGEVRYAVIFAEILALLEYLASNESRETQSSIQGDITSALKAYMSFSQTLKSRDLAHTTFHELLLQSASRLLFHHARTGPFRPALLREHFTNFLHIFPRNTIFLSMYTWNEARLRIDNRVRKIFSTKILTPENDTITSRLFAIRYEIKYGTIHSVRSAFENALSSPSRSSSAGLWKFYILYCLDTEPFRGATKDVWYRAINACPWAKELYIFGLEKLEGLLTFAELKSIWRVLGEKELRVHVDLEDKFEEFEKSEMGKRLAFRQ